MPVSGESRASRPESGRAVRLSRLVRIVLVPIKSAALKEGSVAKCAGRCRQKRCTSLISLILWRNGAQWR